jgi:hypothetical protein
MDDPDTDKALLLSGKSMNRPIRGDGMEARRQIGPGRPMTGQRHARPAKKK